MKEMILTCTIHSRNNLHFFNSRASSSQEKPLGTLCEETLDSFKECLHYDLQTFKENSEKRISSILSGEHPDTSSAEVLLPPDVLLKLVALSILPSHCLRQLGINACMCVNDTRLNCAIIP